MRALDSRLLQRALPARRLLVVDALLGVAAALVVLVQATLLARVAARAFHGAALGDVSRDIVLLLLAFATRAALVWGFETAGRRASAKTLSELRLALVAQRLRGHPAALDGERSADVATAAVEGVDGLDAYFGRYLPQVVLACVVPVAVLVWVGVVDLVSAFVLALTLPLVPVFMWLIGRYTEEHTRRHEALRQLSVHFLDVVRGLPTLRAFNRSRVQAETIADVSDRYRRATMGTLRVAFLSGAVLELASTLGVALVAVTVGVRLDRGQVGLQAALTVLLLAPELYLPLRQLATQYHASADGLAGADTLLALLDAPPAVRAEGQRMPPSPADASVRLEDVTFEYPARSGLVLAGVSLELEPGETVALVGASGAGKSTVAKLLLRLAEPSSGAVSAGGVDLGACDTDEWRKLVAWVPQHPTIFRGTVAENIRLGDPTADDARVWGAAESAGADEFLRALPEGYETVVGDGGRALSAGEARRIALARAFLRDAPLVVLDEPTADLDPASAEHVAAAVERLGDGRTVLVIAHRPELVRRADRVVTLEAGRIVDGQEVAA